jgi:hypothetical protein
MTPYYVALGALLVISGIYMLAKSHGHSIPANEPQPPDSTLAPAEASQEGDSTGPDESALSPDFRYAPGNAPSALLGGNRLSHAIPIDVFMDLRQTTSPLGICAENPRSRNFIVVIGLSFAF